MVTSQSQIQIQEVSLTKEMEKSYLEYSLASISRAIPDYRDGLLPIHRRIIWAAKEFGFSSQGPFQKCAKLDGNVTGNYSPHGTSYGSIVTLCTEYNFNYPLLNGHGNFGDSTSGPAASRYTETKLRNFTEDVLLQELNAIQYKDNYDGRKKEPVYLNAKLPILLLRGSNSIATGYATTIAQYNLKEIREVLKGERKRLIPDFPTGCDVIPDRENHNKYSLRAIISREESIEVGKRKKKLYRLVEFTNLPYGSNPEKIGEQIKKLVQRELLERDSIISVEDLSDRTGDCVGVTLLEKDYKKIIYHLYKYTDLETSFNENFTVLVDGIPKNLSPTEYLSLWKSFRLDSIVHYNKTLENELKLEISLLTDLVKILQDKGKLLSIIDDDNLTYEQCVKELMKFYSVSKESITYLMSLPIKKLTSLESSKYSKDLNLLERELKKVLSNIKNPSKVFNQEIDNLVEAYVEERKSKIRTKSFEGEESVVVDKSKRGFSLDKKRGFVIEGSDYQEPVIAICSDGKAYRISPISKFGPITAKPVKILFIKDSKYTDDDILEINDSKNSLSKRVKLADITATSKGTNLGFTNISSAKINNSKSSKIPVKGKSSKPVKI